MPGCSSPMFGQKKDSNVWRTTDDDFIRHFDRIVPRNFNIQPTFCIKLHISIGSFKCSSKCHIFGREQSKNRVGWDTGALDTYNGICWCWQGYWVGCWFVIGRSSNNWASDPSAISVFVLRILSSTLSQIIVILIVRGIREHTLKLAIHLRA